MRYNPSTDRALSIDEIASQCKAAILKSAPAPAPAPHDEVVAFLEWECEWNQNLDWEAGWEQHQIQWKGDVPVLA
jgi:hypothetical protein